ncbi:hypothetical protein BSKO_05814 [Bryopsis sp. KO-2023]|nr:hypothetical protein BSKO_05814 [Bryopsis sp. KO-2023]
MKSSKLISVIVFALLVACAACAVDKNSAAIQSSQGKNCLDVFPVDVDFGRDLLRRKGRKNRRKRRARVKKTSLSNKAKNVNRDGTRNILLNILAVIFLVIVNQQTNIDIDGDNNVVFANIRYP